MKIRKIFHKLFSIDEALKSIEENIEIKPIGIEEVDLKDAVGRILAEDIIADIDLPPFDRAAMDGYAVKAEDTYKANEEEPVKLRVIGKIESGEEPILELESGQAIEISTGAPIPFGANAVVMVEYTHRENDHVMIYKPVTIGENIVQSGSDLMIGETILRSGEKLTRREIGVLAALGISRVKVYKKPRVVVISTGNELIKPGEKLQPYKVYDVNTYSISSAIIESGGEPIIIGVVRDCERDIKSKIVEALEKSDIVLISGGTSAGVGDLVYRVLNDIGKPGIIVHGLKIKPGKPTVIAIANGKLIVGLPGWPVSALMIYGLIIEPILSKMIGIGKINHKEINVKIARRVKCERGRDNLIPVSIIIDDEGKFIGYPLMEHSGAIATLKRADGYFIAKENREFIEEGEEVKVKLFSEMIDIPDATIIGSHCPALEEITKILGEMGYKIKTISSGSMDGLISIINGEADIAGIHILDEKTMKYNIPILEEMKLKNAVLVKGYSRIQGLIISKGNEKNIKGFEDLLRSDIKFINRNKGSGTRIFIDYMLKKVAKERGLEFEEIKKKIKGYYIEAKTHSSIASAIKLSKADVGVGIKTVAVRYDLGFIPLTIEEYDFIIKEKSLNKNVIKDFIKVLKSEDFKKILKSLGMEPSKDAGEIIWGVKSE
ncbi:MAG: molybdopterin biosynthesis protein [Candidatus Methanomethylicia archaeon]